MKSMLAICLILAASFASAGEKSVPVSTDPSAVRGEILEVRDVESYTYLRLKTKNGEESWAAVSKKAPLKKGETVTIENVTVMSNFESKSLKQTFPTIYFGTLAGAGSATPSAPHAAAAKTPTEPATIRVPKAKGANARTVAEIINKAPALKDKEVLVRGKIVKYNPGIMGKNWIHLRDGSGSELTNTHDILVTTTNDAKLGDIVTVKGVVHTAKDFGGGYAYKVLIEEATLLP